MCLLVGDVGGSAVVKTTEVVSLVVVFSTGVVEVVVDVVVSAVVVGTMKLVGCTVVVMNICSVVVSSPMKMYFGIHVNVFETHFLHKCSSIVYSSGYNALKKTTHARISMESIRLPSKPYPYHYRCL